MKKPPAEIIDEAPDPARQPADCGPDWSDVTEEILCPLCDYNLRGLRDERCPECGYRFEWTELLDPQTRRHPYLFEHYPNRNFWSFWKTLRGGLRPRRFWSTIHPRQQIRSRRLAGYYMISLFLILVSALIPVVSHFANHMKVASKERARLEQDAASAKYAGWVQTGILRHGSLDAFLDSMVPPVGTTAFYAHVVKETASCDQFLADVRQRGLIPVMLCICWIWFSYAALLLFQWSMRRAHVNYRHVLRCVVYSFDAWIWMVIIGLPATFLLSASPVTNVQQFSGIIALILLIVIPLHIIRRLVCAYRQYLRFESAMVVVLVSQAICALIFINILVLNYWVWTWI